MIKCPDCQTTNPEGAKFCMNCGHPLALACSNCGTELPATAKFCFNCGQRLESRDWGLEIDNLQSPISNLQPTLHQYISSDFAVQLEAARGSRAMVGERRIVTILFSDVKGSTAMAGDLDPEDWAEIMNNAFEYLIAPVYRYEGTVARLMGDAILAFFGAPIAHEDDPQRAVLAGLDILQDITPYREQVKQRWGLDFNVRIGINTGLVVVGEVGSDLRMEYTALGDAINVAARMEQTAQPGTLLIAEDTYRLVAPLFDVEPLPGIELKGKSTPVTAYRVIAAKAQPGRLRGIAGLDAQLVGRQKELGVLQDALVRLRQGIGAIIFLVGEAGLGKSRLIAELYHQPAADSGRRPLAWYEASSLSYETVQAYGLFQHLIRRLSGAAENESPAAVREKLAPILAHMSDEWRNRAQPVFEALFALQDETDGTSLTGEAFKRGLFDAMRQLWQGLAAREPVVLVFDDLHWTDPASAELLLHLFQLAEGMPLLFLCALRPDRTAPAWSVKQSAETNYFHRYTELNLKALSEAESNALVDSLLTVADLPPRLRQRILAKAEGNPFFVEEVVRTLIESGVVTRDESGMHWRATADVEEIDIPDTLQALLMARIDRLEDEARRTLQLAAVIGRSFYYRVLQWIAANEVTAATATNLDQQLGALLRMDLIREAARIPEIEYVFRHALTQEATYNTILLRRRREFHRRVGEAIEALFPDRLEELAYALGYHFAEAQDARALTYYTLAGDVAYRLYANREAVSHYTEALKVARREGASSEQLIHLYANRGRALELNSQFEEAQDNYREMEALARERSDRAIELAAIMARATLRSTRTPLYDAAQAETLSQKSLVLARELGDQAAEATILWNLMLLQIYGVENPAKAVHYGEQSLAIARELKLRPQIALTLNDLARVYQDLGQMVEARSALEEARALLYELGDLPMLTDNLNTSMLYYYATGGYAQAQALEAEALRASQSSGNIWAKASIAISRSFLALEQGEIGRGIQIVEETFEGDEEAIVPTVRAICYLSLATLYATAGAFGRAVGWCQRATALADEVMPSIRQWGFAALAEGYLVQGDLAAGREALAQSRNGFQPEQPPGTFAPIFVPLAEARLALMEHEYGRVTQLIDDLVVRLCQYGVRAWLAEAFLLKGQALLEGNQPDEARVALTEGRLEAETTGSQRMLWPILAQLARAELRLGNRAEADKLRQQAKEIVIFMADRMGSAELRATFMNLPDARSLFEEIS